MRVMSQSLQVGISSTSVESIESLAYLPVRPLRRPHSVFELYISFLLLYKIHSINDNKSASLHVHRQYIAASLCKHDLHTPTSSTGTAEHELRSTIASRDSTQLQEIP